MRTRAYVLCALLILVAISAWLLFHQHSPEKPEQIADLDSTPKSGLGTSKLEWAPPRSVSIEPTNDPQAFSNAVHEYVQNTIADPSYDWKQPIDFYGKVVDENEIPLGGADIRFVWNDLSEHGTSEFRTTSDTTGLFLLENRVGKRLSVWVSKDGYYTPLAAKMSFEYANPADGLFKPDRDRPVVFRLRRKGTPADLITSQFGVRSNFPIHIPRDGTPLWVDFLQRKTGESGQMRIIQSKPEYERWREADYWSFQIEIADGGFVEHNDEFPFEAPEHGYQPTVSFEFRKGDVGWTEGINKHYYLRFGNPPRYGRLDLQTGIDMGGAFLTYAINPDGSRNLEPKQLPP